MRLSNISDVKGFFNLVDGCSGNVYLVTPRGDKLNLKSKLAQYYSLANIFTGENGTISDVTLSVPNPDDAVKFMEFMINGDGEAVRTTKTA